MSENPLRLQRTIPSPGINLGLVLVLNCNARVVAVSTISLGNAQVSAVVFFFFNLISCNFYEVSFHSVGCPEITCAVTRRSSRSAPGCQAVVPGREGVR